MAAYSNDILLGRIIKVSGFEGTIAVKLEKSFTENIPGIESVFLEIEGRPVPFFISDIEYSGADILKLKFEDYESVEKVAEFTGCNVYLTTSFPDTNNPDDNIDLLGFEIFVHGKKRLGSIVDLIPNSGQWLIIVLSEGNKEILIPFHENFIVEIDEKNKAIHMELPEGLTEINI